MLLDYSFMADQITRKGIRMPIGEGMEDIPLTFGKLEIYQICGEEHQFILRLDHCPDGEWECPEGEKLRFNLNSWRRRSNWVDLSPRRWGPHLMMLSGTGWYPAGSQSLLECNVHKTVT